MKAQFNNLAMSSYALWLDNRLCNKGEGYFNTNSKFYPISQVYKSGATNFYTYSLPYSQLVADQSVSGANVMTGVYLGNFLASKGVSGLMDINYNKGQIYFSNKPSVQISGNFAVKDFNIEITSNTEELLWFEQKYTNKNKTIVSPTGIPNDVALYPIIYLKLQTNYNEPKAFGGLDDSIIKIRGMIVADSEFQLNAASSLIADSVRSYVPIVYQNEMPFNNFGGVNGAGYNYTGLTVNKVQNDAALFITESRPTTFIGNLNTMQPGVSVGFFDVTLSKFRYPRI